MGPCFSKDVRAPAMLIFSRKLLTTHTHRMRTNSQRQSTRRGKFSSTTIALLIKIIKEEKTDFETQMRPKYSGPGLKNVDYWGSRAVSMPQNKLPSHPSSIAHLPPNTSLTFCWWWVFSHTLLSLYNAFLLSLSWGTFIFIFFEKQKRKHRNGWFRTLLTPFDREQ